MLEGQGAHRGRCSQGKCSQRTFLTVTVIKSEPAPRRRCSLVKVLKGMVLPGKVLTEEGAHRELLTGKVLTGWVLTGEGAHKCRYS